MVDREPLYPEFIGPSVSELLAYIETQGFDADLWHVRNVSYWDAQYKKVVRYTARFAPHLTGNTGIRHEARGPGWRFEVQPYPDQPLMTGEGPTLCTRSIVNEEALVREVRGILRSGGRYAISIAVDAVLEKGFLRMEDDWPGVRWVGGLVGWIQSLGPPVPVMFRIWTHDPEACRRCWSFNTQPSISSQANMRGLRCLSCGKERSQ